MTSIGDALRRERLNRNLELAQISKDLKISSRMLAAIEDENFDKLPGGVFSRSFVRQYAQYLGFDADEIASRMVRILNPTPDVPAFVETVRPQAQPIQVPPVENWETVGSRRFSWRSPLMALGMVVVAMLGCAGVYAWWSRGRHVTLSHEQPAQPGAAVQTSADASAAVQTATPEIPQPSPDAPPETTASSAPSTDQNPNAPVRVQMTAAEPVWISVTSDGKTLFAGVLEANQSRSVDANATVLLRLGNAGGVSILLNGKSIGSVGPRGQVRNVQLTSGGFEIVAPKSASLEPM
jgi:cytoskeletal protein RodZ